MTDILDTMTTTNSVGLSSATDSELVAFGDCEFIRINEATMIVINRENGNQQIMTSQVVAGLKTCSEFKTIDAHAAHLANTRSELDGDVSMAVAALNGLRDAGMLLVAKDVCSKLEKVIPRQLPPTRAFIITCDRPVAVERLLESMLRAGKLSQHDALFLVDDSRESENRAANRELVAKFNLRSAKDMLYFGEDAQDALLSELIKKLPSHISGIRFLLDRSLWQGHKTYGRSRTLCLLLSIGYRALIMDDDIICQAMLPPIVEGGVGIGSEHVRKATFYSSEQELMQSGRLADFDPLSGHATLLGTTLSHALQAANSGPLQESQLLNVNAMLANLLMPDSSIIVTQCGSLGDPGTSTTHWGLFQSEDSIERMIAAPHGIREALENRLNWLGSTRPNFFKMPFMSQVTGLDNSQLLPPYFPAFRGEDGLFGAMLVNMHRDSVSLEYPWSVPHRPVDARSFNSESLIGTTGSIALFSSHLTRNINYLDGTSPENNLGCIASEALRLSVRPDMALTMDFRAELGEAQVNQLHALQSQLSLSEKYHSTELRGYFERNIEALQSALSVAQSPARYGAAINVTEAEALAYFRSVAGNFSAALTGWVDMRSVASDLTERMISSRQLLQ